MLETSLRTEAIHLTNFTSTILRDTGRARGNKSANGSGGRSRCKIKPSPSRTSPRVFQTRDMMDRDINPQERSSSPSKPTWNYLIIHDFAFRQRFSCRFRSLKEGSASYLRKYQELAGEHRIGYE
jgi:hypothetical protein